jgi:hypothetical protein
MAGYKKIYSRIFFILIFLSIAINAFAKVEMSPWVGSTTMHFKNIRGVVPDNYSVDYKTNEDNKQLAGLVGIDVLFGIGKDFKIGPRLCSEYADCELVSKEALASSTNKIRKGVCSTNAYSIMLGGSYSKNISEKFRVNGKIFLGADYVRFYCPSLIGDKKNLKKFKSCFISDLSLGIEWLFTKRIGIGFDFGYRFTPEVVPSKDIKLDFSGFVYNLGVSYKI